MSPVRLYVFVVIEIQRNRFQRVVMHVSIVKERRNVVRWKSTPTSRRNKGRRRQVTIFLQIWTFFENLFGKPFMYSSASLSNLEPGMPSSSVRTVQDWSELLTIHVFFPRTLTEFDFVCLSHDGGQNFVTSLVQSAILALTVTQVWVTTARNATAYRNWHAHSGATASKLQPSTKPRSHAQTPLKHM